MSVALVDLDGTANFCIYSDPGMKLFGRDIPLKQEASEEPSTISTVQLSSHQDDQADSVPQIMECKVPMDISIFKPGNKSCLEDGSNLGSTSVKRGDSSDPHDTLHKSEEVQGTVTLEKTTKKPDKLLPCPRCNSLDTKFCYFNNYNVNQPRHFCRKCQRYWTAGGTLRNVPVGAGRRKNKHSALQQKHAIISEASAVRTIPAEVVRHRFGSTSANTGASLGSSCKPRLHTVPLDAPSVSTSDSPATNNSILTFGQDSPLSRSMAATSLGMQEMTTLQNLEGVYAEVSMPADVSFAAGGGVIAEPEGLASSVKIIPPSCQANGSLSHPSNAVQLQQGQLTKNADSKGHQMQVGEVTPPTVHGGIWQPGSNMMSMNPFSFAASPSPDGENIAASSFAFLPANSLPCNGATGSFWPGFPWPFMTPVMWGAPPSLEWAGPWTLPIYSSGAAAVAAAAAASVFPHSIAGTSPSKHQAMERSQPEKCLWAPKTLRIDDPLNAARSSIWTTLGLGDGPRSSPAQESTNAFQAKSDSKDDKENTVVSTNRLSNPAALLRSAVFQESS